METTKINHSFRLGTSRAILDIGKDEGEICKRVYWSYLANNIFVGDSYDETIFGGIVFIFVLVNECMTSVKISFTL